VVGATRFTHFTLNKALLVEPAELANGKPPIVKTFALSPVGFVII